MSGAEAKAGIQGHAFMASWLVKRDRDEAIAAFKGALNRPEQPFRPGWYSDSGMACADECLTRYWLRYVARRELVRAPESIDPIKEAKALDRENALAAQALDACLWIADKGHDGRDRFTTLATELYVTAPPPFTWHGFADELLLDRTREDALGIRDHKFTWREDMRVVDRMRYGDQLKLYASIINRCSKVYGWGLPRVSMLYTNVVCVRSNSRHTLMPGEPVLFGPDDEAEFVKRFYRKQQYIDNFRAAAQADAQGWRFAREFMQTRSCVSWGTCFGVSACHLGADPLTDARYRESTRPVADESEDAT